MELGFQRIHIKEASSLILHDYIVSLPLVDNIFSFFEKCLLSTLGKKREFFKETLRIQRVNNNLDYNCSRFVTV